MTTIGVRELAVSLHTLAESARPKAAQVVAKSALSVEAGAKNRAPVDTGALRNSIGTDVSGLSATVGPTVHYAPYLEFGTRRMAARPFMGPAADIVAPSFEAALLGIAEL